VTRCLTIHETPEFEDSYNSDNKKQKYEVEKLRRFLKSDSGDVAGECLKYDLVPFKSFPQGDVDIRCLFILCRDCKGDVLTKDKCNFCQKEGHTMQDAVLIFVGDHKGSYKKEGKKLIHEYKGI